MVAEARDQDLGRALLVERSLVRSWLEAVRVVSICHNGRGYKKGEKIAGIHGDCVGGILAMGIPYGHTACRASAPVLFRRMLG